MLEIERKNVDWAVIARFVGFSAVQVIKYAGKFLFGSSLLWFWVITTFAVGAVYGVMAGGGDVSSIVADFSVQRPDVARLTFVLATLIYLSQSIPDVLFYGEEDHE